MNTRRLQDSKPHYINPYLGGVLLGLTLLVTVLITGRELGASGAVTSAVVATSKAVTPAYTKANAYMNKRLVPGHSPLDAWLVYEVVGMFLGGLLSGVIFGRVKKPVIEHGPRISPRTRVIMAIIGGVLFGAGSRFGRGCTSGAALSGAGTFSFGGVIVMFCIFGAAYGLAYFVRRLWI